MADRIILFWLYVLPAIPVLYLLYMLRKALIPRRVSIYSQMRHYFDMRKADVIAHYQRQDMHSLFEEAGLIAKGITPARFRIVRDLLFVVLVVGLNVRYVANVQQGYPIAVLVVLLTVYLMLHLHESFPIRYVLLGLKSRHDRLKNTEIFILQQLISNEYADPHTSKQNVYHMFLYLRQFLTYTRPAVDRFLEQYPLDPHNKEKAFKSFAVIVGTKEAESLAEILYQVDQSSPEEIHEILTRRYEELKKKRQEIYRGTMKDRGVVAYVLTFSGVMMVIICGLFVYYLEYQDMMNATYNLN
ncbi:hypothetical protein [Paenibacillus marinisediminis]